MLCIFSHKIKVMLIWHNTLLKKKRKKKCQGCFPKSSAATIKSHSYMLDSALLHSLKEIFYLTLKKNIFFLFLSLWLWFGTTRSIYFVLFTVPLQERKQCDKTCWNLIDTFPSLVTSNLVSTQPYFCFLSYIFNIQRSLGLSRKQQ